MRPMLPVFGAISGWKRTTCNMPQNISYVGLTNQARRGIAFPFSVFSFRPFSIVNPAPRKVIVIVDDEPSYAGLMSQLLTDSLDCEVAAFTSPLDALAAFPSLEVGVVVTDFSMPKLNGL